MHFQLRTQQAVHCVSEPSNGRCTVFFFSHNEKVGKHVTIMNSINLINKSPIKQVPDEVIWSPQWPLQIPLMAQRVLPQKQEEEHITSPARSIALIEACGSRGEKLQESPDLSQ